MDTYLHDIGVTDSSILVSYDIREENREKMISKFSFVYKLRVVVRKTVAKESVKPTDLG